MIKLGSLFDGIGGWPLAAVKAGAVPVWASEIEKFPQQVTEKHFPDMKQLGDITKVDGSKIEPVDIITIGSPCQDLSVAGKREGLAGARSGLFMDAIRIVREMRKATNGKYPRFIVWENVPGAFSSNKGADFRAVLEEIGETSIPMPKSGRWSKAGMVRSENFKITWRVLDAQYWGVPQRRKRIFLVADLGGKCAGEILFKPESVSRDTEKSSSEGERVTGTAENCFRAAGFKPRNSAKSRSIGYAEEQSPTLSTSANEIVMVYDMTHANDVIRTAPDGIVPTLNARMGTGENQVPLVQKYVYGADLSQKAEGIGFKKEVSVCLTIGTHAGHGAHVISEVIPINDKATRYKGGGITRQNDGSGNGLGIGKPGDPAPTLTSCDRHAVSYCVGNGQLDQAKLSDKVGALNCMHDQQAIMIGYQNKIGCLNARDYKGVGNQYVNEGKCIVDCEYKVRRLTPTECERLQGLIDGYTVGGSDSARYKALGNGMAQPCPDFVIKRIVDVLEGE